MLRPTEWGKFDDERLVRRLGDHIYVIRPRDMSGHIPIFCPVCDFAMSTTGDMHMYKKFTCCEWCANNWAYPLASAWSTGWRPTADDIGDVLKKRNRAPLGFNPR